MITFPQKLIDIKDLLIREELLLSTPLNDGRINSSVNESEILKVITTKFDKCTLKCNPDEIVQLKADYQAVEDPFNLSKKYWVGIRFNEDMPDDKIKAYVKQSYDLVASSQKNKLVK